MTDSLIHLFEFLCVFVLVCIVIRAAFKKLTAFTITKDGLTAKFDFYVDTKNEPTDPTKWEAASVSKKQDCSLESFRYFVVNDIWKQIPLSKNDTDNFEMMQSAFGGSAKDEVIEKYWQRNYLFNIKFADIDRLVREYKVTKEDVFRSI